MFDSGFYISITDGCHSESILNDLECTQSITKQSKLKNIYIFFYINLIRLKGKFLFLANLVNTVLSYMVNLRRDLQTLKNIFIDTKTFFKI